MVAAKLDEVGRLLIGDGKGTKGSCSKIREAEVAKTSRRQPRGAVDRGDGLETVVTVWGP